MKVIKSIWLLIVAIVLGVLFFPIGFVALFIRKGSISEYFKGIALSIDQLGNHVMKYSFNQWMIQQHGYRFGNIDDTVSYVLGNNYITGTLTPSGKFLVKVLNKLDKDHVIKSVKNNEKYSKVV